MTISISLFTAECDTEEKINGVDERLCLNGWGKKMANEQKGLVCEKKQRGGSGKVNKCQHL